MIMRCNVGGATALLLAVNSAWLILSSLWQRLELGIGGGGAELEAAGLQCFCAVSNRYSQPIVLLVRYFCASSVSCASSSAASTELSPMFV